MRAVRERVTPQPSVSLRSREPIWTWVVLAVPIAMACVVMLLLLAPLQGQGPFVDWLPGYDVAAVDVFGLRLHREVIDVGTKDLLVAVGLSGIAVLTAATAATLWRREGGTERVLTFAISAGVALYLAVDEILSVHETVGLQLGVLRGLPFVDHPDNVIVAIYGALLLTFAILHRRVFLASAPATWCFAVACIPILAAVLLDFAPTKWSSLEETLEALGVATGGLAILLLVVHHLRTAPRNSSVAAPGAAVARRSAR